MELSAVPKFTILPPLKRYKITVQELPDVDQDSVANKDNVHLKDEHSALAGQADPLSVSITAAMPSSVMSWLLSAAAQRDHVGTTLVESLAALQPIEEASLPKDDKAVNLPASTPTDPSSSITSTQSRADVDRDTAATTTAAAAAAATAATTATVAATAASLASSNSSMQEQPAKEASVPSTHQPSPQQESNDTRTWWQRRRDARLQRDQSNQKEESSMEQEHQGSRQHWPPRRRSAGPSETFTQTTITRPDGTVESKSVTSNRETGITETRTRVQRPDGSFHESVLRQDDSSISKGTTESDASQSPSVRERWSQRRQERMERREEMREERRRERQERRQELREAEARQREATAAACGFVHPATAGLATIIRVNHILETMVADEKNTQHHQAPTLVQSSQEKPSRSAWHQRREERRQEREQQRQREEEEARNENQESVPSTGRTWPPQGYVRRMEREQEEPRHNV
ncbi:hypothetical protein BGX31_001547 [Mortierella sp. GBA43]|nr:hypothetical protein BGX31_001547 [Mortierella sp. GBA43]